MSSETLRRAAALMRERAEVATPGPWGWSPHPDSVAPWPTEGVWSGDPDNCHAEVDSPTDADHMASWHPAVALAVADWLEAMARAVVGASRGDVPFEDAALAVARAYLGEDA